jgi:uncharacterized membrane protein
MKSWLIAYVATLVVFLAVDAIWLGTVATGLYRDAIGHLMLDRPNFLAAAVFYAIYVVGILVFAVMPALQTGQWTDALIKGALFGFFAYLTYDMTNLATLKGWPLWIAALDTAWGTLLTGAAATGGFLISRWAAGAATN